MISTNLEQIPKKLSTNSITKSEFEKSQCKSKSIDKSQSISQNISYLTPNMLIMNNNKINGRLSRCDVELGDNNVQDQESLLNCDNESAFQG